MIALGFKCNVLSLWGMIDVDRFLSLEEDLQMLYLDILMGRYGAKAQYNAYNQRNALELHKYLKKYAGTIHNRQRAARYGYEVCVVKNKEEKDGIPSNIHTVSENALTYLETEFDSVISSESVEALISNFNRQRTRILCAEHIDICVLFYNINKGVTDEEQLEVHGDSGNVLKLLCQKYDLHDLFRDLLECKDVYDRVMATFGCMGAKLPA